MHNFPHFTIRFMRDRTGYVLSSHDIKLKPWNSLTTDFVDVKYLHRFRKQLNAFIEEKSIRNYWKIIQSGGNSLHTAKNWVCIKNYYLYLSFLCFLSFQCYGKSRCTVDSAWYAYFNVFHYWMTNSCIQNIPITTK